MTRFKVVIADPPAADHSVEAATFASSGLDLETLYLGTRDVDRVVANAADADALIVSWVHLTRAAIAASSSAASSSSASASAST